MQFVIRVIFLHASRCIRIFLAKRLMQTLLQFASGEDSGTFVLAMRSEAAALAGVTASGGAPVAALQQS